MRLSALALAALLCAFASGPAAAWELDAAGLTAVEQGRPWVLVRPEPDGDQGLVRGAIDIAAPPAVVWRTISDCDLAPRMVATLKSCRILERDPAGRWDIREHISRPTFFLPPVRSVFRSDYEGERLIRFHRTAGDLERLEGEWRLVELPNGAGTRVLYENRATAPFRLPGALVRMALRRDVPDALLALRRESLARRP